MKVKDLVKRLETEDQNAEVFVEATFWGVNSKIVISQTISGISGRAGGSLDKRDSRFYGVVLRSDQ